MHIRAKSHGLNAYQKEAIEAYVFILPLLFGLIVFNIIPIFVSAAISLTNWDIMTEAKFVGFGNFVKLWNDKIFVAAFRNTIYYTVVSVPLQLVLSFVLALLVNHRIRGISFFRSCFFLPVITSTVAISTVWYWIYNGDYGLINLFLYQAFGIIGPNWLGSKDWAMISIIIMSLWKGTGYYMVIFLAALQDVPQELYESAQIDGASSFRQMLNITLPLVSPTTFFILIMTIISSFQMFEQSYIMTGGGPSYATISLVLYVFNQGFQYFRMGYASAIAWILFILIMIMTAIQKYLQNKWVFYY